MGVIGLGQAADPDQAHLVRTASGAGRAERDIAG